MTLSRRAVLVAGAASAGLLLSRPASAAPIKLRISTPAVDSDWHAKMLTVFKEELDKSAPGEFDVEIHLNGTLFKQGTEPAAMQRGNLDMAMISAFDIAKQIPAWSVFTAGYLIRDPDHQRRSSTATSARNSTSWSKTRWASRSSTSAISARASSIFAARRRSRRRPISPA